MDEYFSSTFMQNMEPIKSYNKLNGRSIKSNVDRNLDQIIYKGQTSRLKLNEYNKDLCCDYMKSYDGLGYFTPKNLILDSSIWSWIRKLKLIRPLSARPQNIRL